MIKYTIAAIALLAGTSLVYADPADHGNSGGGGMSNSASEHAPGQMKDSGSAKEPGTSRQDNERMPAVLRKSWLPGR